MRNKYDLQGDGYCDDATNTADCDWDGGDCCNPNAILDLCEVCFCLDTTFGTSTDVTVTANTGTTVTTTTSATCTNLAWVVSTYHLAGSEPCLNLNDFVF